MEHRITLNGTWNWCDTETKEWHKGSVPGTVLTDMADGGLILSLIHISEPTRPY